MLNRLFFFNVFSLLLLSLGVICHYTLSQPTQIIADLFLLMAVTLHSNYVWGRRKTLIYISLAMLIGYLVELVGINTGLIFGPYHYNPNNALMIFGVPLFIPILYAVLLYAGNFLCIAFSEQLLFKSNLWLLSLLTACILTLKDFITDPVQSTVKQVWIWENGGSYFGVPIQNFLGWMAIFFVMSYVTITFSWHTPSSSKKIMQKNLFIFPLILFLVLILFGLTAGYNVPTAYSDLGNVSIFISLITFTPYLLLAWFIRFKTTSPKLKETIPQNRLELNFLLSLIPYSNLMKVILWCQKKILRN